MASRLEIQEVIDATDIVALVSEYVTLEKSGKNYRGLCPFHHEDTPSFLVNQEKKIAHCFGCGGGGDPIHFLMQIENIDFPTALHRLAKRNGITISDGYEESAKPNPLNKYYKIMDTTQRYYVKYLENSNSGEEAKKYLSQRGIDEETIKVFGIGLAPQSGNSLFQVLKDSNYLELDMTDCGLVDKNENGYHDFFVKRIMFPIFDEAGKPIAYSARVYRTEDKNQPKYINSKDTPLFRKKETLYNLHLAKGEILKKKRVILCEGQMDVIASYRSGLKETICTMGTALTANQVLKLKSYTNHVILCYDGDNAGIHASLKAIPLFLKYGFQIHLVLLPDGMDPDEYSLKYGCEAYVAYFESHLMDYHLYIFEQAVKDKNFADDSVVLAVKDEIFEMLRTTQSKTIEEQYLTRLADILHCRLEALITDYDRYCKRIPMQESVDIYPVEENNPIKDLEEEKWSARYEERLFMFAKQSKEKALEIDRLIEDRLDGFCPENLRLWIGLIDGYYTQYDEFDEETFISSLSEENQKQYEKIINHLRADINPYDEVDLQKCIEQLEIAKYKKRNKKLDEVMTKQTDLEEIAKTISEKFKNKQNQQELKNKRRK